MLQLPARVRLKQKDKGERGGFVSYVSNVAHFAGSRYFRRLHAPAYNVHVFFPHQSLLFHCRFHTRRQNLPSPCKYFRCIKHFTTCIFFKI